MSSWYGEYYRQRSLDPTFNRARSQDRSVRNSYRHDLSGVVRFPMDFEVCRRYEEVTE
ncbi:hypothetical protein U2F10_36240 [Leptothoe sp. EHU-05/26/07-4]